MGELYKESPDQWETNGKCNVCRRQKYCTKACKAHKKRREFELRLAVQRAIAKTMMGES